jgi:ABC-type sulfate transport system permease component
VRRRILIAAALGVLLLVLQLLAGHGIGAALASAVIGFVVAFVVLLLSDRWFARRGR